MPERFTECHYYRRCMIDRKRQCRYVLQSLVIGPDIPDPPAVQREPLEFASEMLRNVSHSNLHLKCCVNVGTCNAMMNTRNWTIGTRIAQISIPNLRVKLGSWMSNIKSGSSEPCMRNI
jgi:hypothetical protein